MLPSLPSMPSMPDVSVPTPSQALTKAGDVFTSTINTITSKAGEVLDVFSEPPPPLPPILLQQRIYRATFL